ARVEHLQAQDVEGFGWPGPDDLGEGRNADAHQLAAGSFLGLLAAQVLVADHVHGFAERPAIVAAVVVPTEGRAIWEAVRLDEVFLRDLSGVVVHLVGYQVGLALDGVARFGHPERAGVGDASGWFVGIDPVALDESVLEVIRAGTDMEQPGREL